MRNGFFVLWATAVLVVAGCAAPTTRPVSVSAQATDAEAIKQTELVVQDLVQKQERIRRVYRLLATRAQHMCGEHVGPDTGLVAMVKPKGDVGTILERNYGIRDELTILFVLEGSPAQVAGLKAGDVIKKVNGARVPDDKSLQELNEKLPPEAPISYEVERSATALTISVQPERACSYRIMISPSQAVNALADGKRILVTRGMANFAADDGELALVIAHEMAHNVMRHIEAKKTNAGTGLVADLAILLLSRGQVSTRGGLSQAAAMAYSQEFEAEADYVGLYIMANAGLSIDDAPLFWRRMAAAHPGSIRSNHAASHPSTAQRMVALESTVREIDAKLAANEPLRPNMRDGHVAPSSTAAAGSPSASPARSAARAPAPASAPARAAAATPAPLALAAPARAVAAPAAATGERLPAAGTSWTYEVSDRIYRRNRTSLTVDVMNAAHQVVEERLSVGSGLAGTGKPTRAIDARSASFLELSAGAGTALVEFAPYFLAAHGERAPMLAFDPVGYPAGPGNPGWVVRQTQPPVWQRVTVPAGSFRALLMEFEGQREVVSYSPIVTYRFQLRVWYAPEVNRYVRLEHQEWLRSRQSSDIVLELVKFKPPS